MRREEPEAEALRRRLYRPGATDADLAGYLRATNEQPVLSAAESRPIEHASTLIRPFVIGGAAVVAGASLVAVLLAGGPPTPAAPPTRAARTAATSQEADGSRTIRFPQNEIADGGAADHATGSAQRDGSQIIRYAVADGDTVTGIADRFGLCLADVMDALPYGVDPSQLPRGARLELSRSESNEC